MFETTNWLLEHGMTEELLLILLFIPLIATLVNFARYIIGLNTLGIYAPLTLSFAYFFTGIRFGLLITLAVVVGTLISYTLLKKIRMHYISRITVNYSIITALIILVIVVNESSPFQITTQNHNIAALPPLGVLLIVTLSDFFVKQYVKSNLLRSVRKLGETILVGIAGWALLRSGVVQNFVLYNLWLQPVLIIVNLMMGKYTGMRLKDYFRFKQLLKID